MAKLKATPTNYAEALEVLKGRDSMRLGNNTYLVDNWVFGYIGVRLHNTHIVRFYQDGRVTLHTGGYRTVTTKERINQFISGEVLGKDYAWFYQGVREGWYIPPVEFTEGMEVSQ